MVTENLKKINQSIPSLGTVKGRSCCDGQTWCRARPERQVRGSESLEPSTIALPLADSKPRSLPVVERPEQHKDMLQEQGETNMSRHELTLSPWHINFRRKFQLCVCCLVPLQWEVLLRPEIENRKSTELICLRLKYRAPHSLWMRITVR